jgi:hypothetical protein
MRRRSLHLGNIAHQDVSSERAVPCATKDREVCFLWHEKQNLVRRRIIFTCFRIMSYRAHSLVNHELDNRYNNNENGSHINGLGSHEMSSRVSLFYFFHGGNK